MEGVADTGDEAATAAAGAAETDGSGVLLPMALPIQDPQARKCLQAKHLAPRQAQDRGIAGAECRQDIKQRPAPTSARTTPRPRSASQAKPVQTMPKKMRTTCQHFPSQAH